MQIILVVKKLYLPHWNNSDYKNFFGFLRNNFIFNIEIRIVKMLINTLANRIEEKKKQKHRSFWFMYETLRLATYLAYDQLN